MKNLRTRRPSSYLSTAMFFFLTACGAFAPQADAPKPNTTIPQTGSWPSGLNGVYFVQGQPDLLLFAHSDAQLNFNWNDRLPFTLAPAQRFAARWAGYLVPPKSGRYTLHLPAQGQSHLSLRGQEILDGTSIDLRAGEHYWLQAGFEQTTPGGSFRLEWTDPSGSRGVVPSSAFLSNDVPAVEAAELRSQAVPVGVNLLPNPGFEGDAGWSSSSWRTYSNMLTTTPGQNGTGRALRTTNDPNTSGFQWFTPSRAPVVQGATYAFEVWVKATDAAQCRAFLSMGATNSWVKGTDLTFIKDYPGPSAWEKWSGTIIYPYVRDYFAVTLDHSQGAGDCLFDDANLQLVSLPSALPEPAINLLDNGDFEQPDSNGGPFTAWTNLTGIPNVVAGPSGAGRAFDSTGISETWLSQTISGSVLKPNTAYVLKASSKGTRWACTLMMGPGYMALPPDEMAWQDTGFVYTTPNPVQDLPIYLTGKYGMPCSFDDVRFGPVVKEPPAPATPLAISVLNPISTVGGAAFFDAGDSDADGYHWAYDDGGSDDGAYVSHVFQTPGLHTATLTANRASAPAQTVTTTVAVLPELRKAFTQRAVNTGMAIDYDFGAPLPGFTYAIDFGDGNTGSASRGSHTFSKIGTYAIGLTIRDTRPNAGGQPIRAQGLRAQAADPTVVYQDSSWVTVWRQAPQARFAMTTAAGLNAPFGLAPLSVTFDASGTTDPNADGGPLSYAWDFGDGTSGTGAAPTHVFQTTGRYLVTLTASNQFGLKDTYHAFVHARDIRNGLTLNVFYPTQIAAQSLQAQGLAAQGTGADVQIYYPYVLGFGNNVKTGVFRPKDLQGNDRTTLCTSFNMTVNGATRFPTLHGDADNFMCDYMVIDPGTVGRLPAQTLATMLITSNYAHATDFSVINSVRVPKVLLAILPDEALPGDQAGPIISESRWLDPSTGKDTLVETVRVRQSQLDAQTGRLRFKVPLYAVDAQGRFLNTANGYFNARFDGFNSDCGECLMIDGKSWVTVNIDPAAYGVGGAALDLTRVTTYGNADCTTQNTPFSQAAKSTLNGCYSFVGSSDFPTANAPAINPDRFLAALNGQTTWFNHVLYGEKADDARAWREWLEDGIGEDSRYFATSLLPLFGPARACGSQLGALLGGDPLTMDSVGGTAVACIGMGIQAGAISNTLRAKTRDIADTRRFLKDEAPEKTPIDSSIVRGIKAGDEAVAWETRVRADLGDQFFDEMAPLARAKDPKVLFTWKKLNDEYRAEGLSVAAIQAKWRRIFTLNRPATYSAGYLHHIAEGEVAPDFVSGLPTAQGWHWKPGADPNLATILKKGKVDARGVYKAEVQIKDPVTGQFYKKPGNSTFWPDDWTLDQIKTVVDDAFYNRTSTTQGGIPLKWQGVTTDGKFTIGGFLDKNGDISTAYVVK